MSRHCNLKTPLPTCAILSHMQSAKAQRLVLSGILRSQAAPVASRYAAWFDMRPAIVRDDWALLHGVRRF